MALLAKNPENRPQTAVSVAAELQEIEAALNVTALIAIPLALSEESVAIDPWASIDETGQESVVTTPKTATEKVKRSRPWLLYVSLIALIPLIALAVMVVRIATADGTLVVELHDKDVEARVKNGKLVLLGADGKERYKLEINKSNTPVAAGEYRIRVEGADGLVVDTPEFKLTNGGKVTVRVTVDPKLVKQGKPKPKDPPVMDADRKAAEWVLACGGQLMVWEGPANQEPKEPPTMLGFEDWAKITHLGEREVRAVKDLPASRFVIIKVSLASCGMVNDAGLEVLKGLTCIAWLDLFGTQVTDAGLEAIKGLTRLTYLTLQRSQVTDQGLKHLRGLTTLKFLNLADRHEITDAGLEFLKNLTQLRTLQVSLTGITGVGFRHLGGLTELQEVVLAAGAPATDDGLKQIVSLKKVNKLALSDTKVTDAGLVHLRELPLLDFVSLTNTAVTDEGLAHLAECVNLTHLDLQKTKVTAEGAVKLSKSNPYCKILWGNGSVIEGEPNPDRKAALYVLSTPPGGRLVSINGDQEIRDVSSLPKEKFRLTGVSIIENRTLGFDAELAAFKDCKHLTSLCLENTDAGETGIANFKDCKNLKILNLAGTKVSNAGLAHFADCTSLTGSEAVGNAADHQ